MRCEYCEDCGTKLSSGICPNCQEETYIDTFQSDGYDDNFVHSKEWMEKRKEQDKIIAQRQKKRIKESK